MLNRLIIDAQILQNHSWSVTIIYALKALALRRVKSIKLFFYLSMASRNKEVIDIDCAGGFTSQNDRSIIKEISLMM